MAYCYRCLRSFGSEQALSQHERSSRNHLCCDACDRDFVSPEALLQHYKKSSRHTYCTLCDNLIDHLGTSLNRHYELVHCNCAGCNLVFKNGADMFIHCSDVHHDRWCAPCRSMFQNENNLRQHLGSAIHRRADLPCPMKGCGRSFISTAALILHLESGTCASGLTREMVDRLVKKCDDDVVPYCDRCDRWFTTAHALEQHENNSSMHHICHDCGEDFASNTALIQHFTQSRRHHYCRECDEHFDDRDDFYDHYDEEHNFCRICNQIHDSWIDLHEHRRDVHADEYCVPCERMFRDNNALRQHQRSTLHLGRKWATTRAWNGERYECYLCHRTFAALFDLNQHLNSPAHWTD